MDINNINYDELLRSIEHWNEYRVPILRISHPDSNLNFQGAMRFYFQDSGQKVATKCVNVTSADTTKDVINVLIEKFRPDMRMLSVPEYGLYEIHENGDERKLEPNEKPLLVQLEWNNDDREGRFLLRRMDEKTLAAQTEEPSLKRKLSKKEKKRQEKLKKQQLKEQEKADAAANKLAAKSKNGIAEKLYNELPETSFTRSISNPEAVMKRRRAQKLEKRLHEFSQEGGQESGGTLRIFGETINKDVSYKTLLLSTSDTAASVVKQILEKYGKDDEDPSNYCLVQLIVPPSATSASGDNNSVHDLNTSNGLRESILDDADCPLLINQTHDKSEGILTFHIRHKPADWQKRRKKKPPRIQPNPLHPLVVQQLNQRLQMNNINNNNSEQYHDQNSPQNIMSTSTLPRRFAQTGTDMQDSLQRQAYSHPNMIGQHNNQYPPQTGRIVPQGYQFPIPSPMQPQFIPVTSANDQILPALIQVREDVEDIFLSEVITRIKPTNVSFRLAPTYVLYMVSRYRASTLFHPELQAPSRAELFVPFTRKIATLIRGVIDMHMREQTYLAFWLANSLDLSHFYKQDKHLSHFTLEAQEILYDSIKASFRYMLACRQMELDQELHTFFDKQDELVNQNVNHPINSSFSRIIDFLDSTMSTMRKNRVNASLAILLFSHLFHHISKWLFDRLIGVHDRSNTMNNFAVYCNREWGEKLTRRLKFIVDWSEKHGLERAATFHLARVTQVTMFYSRRYPPRISPQEFKAAFANCDRLNPVQLRALIQRYQPEPHNHPTISAIIQNMLYEMDYSYMTGDYPLEEDFELKTQFLIPDDGYSSEVLRYIPPGLLDFVSYLSKLRVGDQELCIFTLQPTSSGFWTVYFKDYQPDRPEIVTINLRKHNDSMGLSIMAAKGEGQEHQGIYIKGVIKNGAAAMDGRLHAGDQLLEVDGNPLQDINQELAAKLMRHTGPVVTLRIAKQAAIYHNVADIINSPPNETIVQPQVNPKHIPTNFNPPVPFEQIPIPERKLLPPPQMHIPPPQQIERIPPTPQVDLHQIEMNNTRITQFPKPERFVNSMQQPERPNIHPIERPSQVIPEQKQVHFQPPPPSVIFEDQQSSPSTANPTSPMKSPKRVSWKDTQPHQALQTFIPSLPSLTSSPGPQDPSPQPEVQSADLQQTFDDAQFQMNGEAMQNYLNNNYNSGGQHEYKGPMDNQDIVANGDRDEDYDDERDEDPRTWNFAPDTNQPPQTNGHEANDISEKSNANHQGLNGIDTTTESLTLEDIDEVLSSRTNTWIEDTSGVIGTQEVYNDIRTRIVKERERERSNADVTTKKQTPETLGVKDKVKIFEQ